MSEKKSQRYSAAFVFKTAFILSQNKTSEGIRRRKDDALNNKVVPK